MAKMIDKIKAIMGQKEKIRNIGICAHIDHGKTTFSDNLLAGAGMMSEDLAGKACALDFHEDEQQRGITIDSASVSMVHEFEGGEHLINLIDTPGHVDFGGDVTRAMRAVDGAIVVVCAVEGVMPQTETVLRQALKERVKPVLFINKVDRLIKELQLKPEEMQQRFVKIIENVNKLIRDIAEEEYKDLWQVSVNDGTVAFGSAFHNWALSVPFMKKTGASFKDVMDAYEKDDLETLKHKAPLHEVVLDMVIKHLPNPREAQKYRIPKIWHGDPESEIGKALLTCDSTSEPVFVCTKIVYDKHAGEVAAGRLFAGTMKQGMDVYMNGADKTVRVQQVSVYNGAKRDQVEEVPSGNIIGIVGLKGINSGETVSVNKIKPFEQIKHIFDPVVTKAIEAEKAADLPKLIEVLRQVGKEDPTLKIEINEETGENLIHGMGELQLEVVENRIVKDKGVKVKTSPPIVVYRESITQKSPEVEGKSPNKHNKFYITVEPLEDKYYNAIKDGVLPEGRFKKKDKILMPILKKLGMENDVAAKVMDIKNGNIFLENTRGIVHIGEVIELVLDMFEKVMKQGPIAREPCTKVKVILNDTKLHEDAIHRGPAQVYPAVREGIRDAMMQAGPIIDEPIQELLFEAPAEYIGEISKLISNKRGQMLDMKQTGEQATIKGKLPVAEMFGLASNLRSATGGRGTYFMVNQTFEKVPSQLQAEVIKRIRTRKGLSENQ